MSKSLTFLNNFWFDDYSLLMTNEFLRVKVLEILKSPPIKNSFGSVWLNGLFIMLHVFLYVYIVCLVLYV